MRGGRIRFKGRSKAREEESLHISLGKELGNIPQYPYLSNVRHGERARERKRDRFSLLLPPETISSFHIISQQP